MNFKEILANEPIIIVEDDVDLVVTLKELLQEFEVPVQTYTDPREALAQIRVQTPSLIFSDINMQGMTGLELAREVRKNSLTIPFVLLTGFGTKEAAVQALSLGVNDLLDKPVEAEKLLNLTHKILSQRFEFLKREREEIEAILDSFVEEGLDLMRGIDELIMRLSEPELDRLVIDTLFRKIHSIKGSSGAVPYSSVLAKLSHAFESSLDLIRKGTVQASDEHVDLFLGCADMVTKLLKTVGERQEPTDEVLPIVDSLVEQLKQVKSVSPQAGIKSKESREQKTNVASSNDSEDNGLMVSHQKLDAFLKLSGEMTMVRNYFQLLTRDSKAANDPDILFKRAEEMLRGFNKITESLQKNIMEIRQVQFQEVFSKLPRLVRSSAQDCGKKIKLQTFGGSLAVDKSIAKDLAVILSHMVRNSVDHGVEAPHERAKVGKSEEGNLVVEASIAGGIITVEIRDDGGGIDKEKVLGRAIEKGLVEEALRGQMSADDIFQILFLPGFSTAAKVTNISGRGVGMDVVKNLVTNHHGKIEIQSEVGHGTSFKLLIPVPKSVMVENTILMKYEDLFFVVPQAEILSISGADKYVTQIVSGLRYFQYEGKTIPLLTYDEIILKRLNVTEEQMKTHSVVVLHHGDSALGLLVHEMEGQLDAVILPFDGLVGQLPGFKGTTLLGSDGIGYVVSAQQIMQLLTQFHVSAEVAV